MSLDNITKAVANEAWSELVHSIVSDSPPSDMDADYYYTFPESGFHYLQKQLNRLNVYTYKLGSENIQARMGTASMQHSQVLRANELGTELCTRSSEYSEVKLSKEDESQRAMEPIQDCERLYYKVFPEVSIHHLQQNMKRLYIGKCQQGIEYIQYGKRSTPYFGGLKAGEYRNQQGIEYIQNCKRSTPYCHVVEAMEYRNQQGIQHIRGSSRSRALYENLQANGNENRQGIEHIRDCTRSTPYYDANYHVSHQGIEFIRESKKSTAFSISESHESINNIRDIRRSTKSPQVLQRIECAKQQLINYTKEKRMSSSFDKLLEYLENGGLEGGEIPTLRYDVLKVIKLLHHYGLDIIRIGAEEELERVNHAYSDKEKDPEMHYKKKGVEVMLRICEFETCQKIIYEILCKAEGDQVLYKLLW